MNKKKVVIIVVATVAVLGVAGFAAYNFLGVDKTTTKNTIGATAKCGDVFQCIEAIDPNSSIEEINDVIGSDAELADESDGTKIYKWTLADDTTIEARTTTITDDMNGGETTSTVIYANYPENLVGHDADLSRWKEIQEKLNEKDGITYDQFVEIVGGGDGLLIEKSPDSKTYQWFSENGGYLNASFDNESQKCLFMTGQVERSQFSDGGDGGCAQALAFADDIHARCSPHLCIQSRS